MTLLELLTALVWQALDCGQDHEVGRALARCWSYIAASASQNGSCLALRQLAVLCNTLADLPGQQSLNNKVSIQILSDSDFE